MKTVFVSNYYNHHQSALSDALFRRTGGNYSFISTSQMRSDRRALGYGEDNIPEYVINADKDESKMKLAREAIKAADVLIVGSAPEEMIKEAINSGKLIFRYTERPFKIREGVIDYMRKSLYFRKHNPRGGQIYLLCASAYAPGDYSKMGLFRESSYRWGYFTETKEYNLEELFKSKDKKTILWCGRFIDWKHPDDALLVAERLKSDGCDFKIEFIGTGEMDEELRATAEKMNLGASVDFLGSMKPKEVRGHMEKAGILLFTSDRQEGWGAVLNEAMNSGCAVVASHAAGSVPYLIENRKNGLVYPSGNTDELYNNVKALLASPQKQEELGSAAYGTITGLWNADAAAERFITLAEAIINGDKHPDLYNDGPMSIAENIRDEWM